MSVLGYLSGYYESHVYACVITWASRTVNSRMLYQVYLAGVMYCLVLTTVTQ